MRTLERLYRRRVPADRVVSLELTRNLAEASHATGRQVGVLLNRGGQVESVMVGDATRVMLPDVGRLRAAQGRFRGLRLVHTHLRNEPLSRDDLVDLSRLRLDLIVAQCVQPDGGLGQLYWAHLLPENSRGDLWRELGPESPHRFCEQEDFGGLMRSLEQEFARVRRARTVAKDGRAVLVHVAEKRRAGMVEASLRELRELARTAGVEVVDSIAQVREQLDPRYVLGRGKLDEVVLRAMQLDAEVLIFDRDLAPAQAASIAALTDLKVLDRTQLILDIFAQRAQDRDGKLQVELAQLKYMLPRLGQKDDSLSRLTGGIGGRGPGETKLEIAGRRARDRIAWLEAQLEDLSRQRRTRRGRRARSGMPVVALIGYTNAGKSTLLNTLTGAGVLAEDKLFATLDPRSRRLDLGALLDRSSPVRVRHEGATEDASAEDAAQEGWTPPAAPAPRELILTDTVGFIRELPRDLLAAFKATFEEAADADLLLHLVDASDPGFEGQMQTTEKLLSELDLDGIPRLLVFNKLDAAPPGVAAALARTYGGVALSGLDPSTLAPLLERLEQMVFESPKRGRTQRPTPPWAMGM